MNAAENRNKFETVTQAFLDQQADAEQELESEEESEEELPEAAEDDKPNIYNMQATEFMEKYRDLSAEDKKHLVETYKSCLEIRKQQTDKMKGLADWCEGRLIHFSTFKAVFKRANEPKKKQGMIDATHAFFTQELDSDYQLELWEEEKIEINEDEY